MTTSNVPGPPIPLYLAGVRMVAAYPLVATIGAAVNITMVTYDGTAHEFQYRAGGTPVLRIADNGRVLSGAGITLGELEPLFPRIETAE
mgnify:CR=1 FL=1